MLRSFERLPAVLQVLFVMLLNVPIWAGVFRPTPWTVYATSGGAWAAVHTLTFFVAPLAICCALLLRSFVFLPLMLAQCLLLLLQIVSGAAASSVAVPPLLAYGLIGVMLLLVPFLFNKDMLYPFLGRGHRFWRRTRRLLFNKRLELLPGAGGQSSLFVLMSDCSLSGLSFAGERTAVRAALSDSVLGSSVYLQLSLPTRKVRVEGRLAWLRDHGDLCQVGVEVSDTSLMEELIASMPVGGRSSAALRWLEKHWARTGLKRAALALSAASIAGSFVAPSCGSEHSNRRTAGAKDLAAGASQATGAETDAAVTPPGTENTLPLTAPPDLTDGNECDGVVALQLGLEGSGGYLAAGSSLAIPVYGLQADGRRDPLSQVSISIDAANIATVDAFRMVNGVGAGSANLQAAACGLKQTASLTVTDGLTPVETDRCKAWADRMTEAFSANATCPAAATPDCASLQTTYDAAITDFAACLKATPDGCATASGSVDQASAALVACLGSGGSACGEARFSLRQQCADYARSKCPTVTPAPPDCSASSNP